jgi:sortase A
MSTDAAESPTRQRRRLSWTARLGLALVLVGLSILGWLAWEFWGTNWVSHRTQARVVTQIQHDWEAGKPTSLVPEGPGGRSVSARAIVLIPRFGSDYAVPVLEGTSDSVLAAGLGHYDGSARAGGVGNYAVAGHRVTHGEPLRDMPDLRPGDEIIVETRRTVFTYRLDTGGDDLVVPFSASWVLAPLPTNPDGGVQPPDRSPGQRLITLTTCSELFHTDQRLVAFGHLVSHRPRV